MDKKSQYTLRFFLNHDGSSLRDLGVKLDVDGESYARVVLSLRKQGFLVSRPKYKGSDDDSISMEDAIHITQEGRAALEESRRSRLLTRFVEIRAWITLAISVVALILSIISLVLQSG